MLSEMKSSYDKLGSKSNTAQERTNGLGEGFPCGSAGKESACHVGDLGSIPGLGRSPGGEHGYPLQYSGLENSMDCIVHGVSKSQTRLSNFHFHFLFKLRFHHTETKRENQSAGWGAEERTERPRKFSNINGQKAHPGSLKITTG